MTMSDAIVTFDYSGLDDITAAEIIASRNRIRLLEKQTSEHIVEIGQHLIGVKGSLPHGRFGEWIEAEFGWSWSTANRFVRVAEVFGEIRQIGEFDPSALYALASGNVPDELRSEFIAQADAGEPVTHRQVQEALRERKPVVTPTPAPAPDPPMLPITCTLCGEEVKPGARCRCEARPKVQPDPAHDAATTSQSTHPPAPLTLPTPRDVMKDTLRNAPQENIRKAGEMFAGSREPSQVKAALHEAHAKVIEAQHALQRFPKEVFQRYRDDNGIRSIIHDITTDAMQISRTGTEFVGDDTASPVRLVK